MCELTQAGHRNNHKTMAGMQRVNLFLLPHIWGIFQQHLGGGTQVGVQALQTSALASVKKPLNISLSPIQQGFLQVWFSTAL